MSVDEFLAWAEGRPGRHELEDGVVIAMSPERVGHLESKSNAMLALKRGIGRAKCPCHALPDGATVRINNRTAFEPDALVYCGQKLSNKAIEIPNPVIVVEVLSDSTARRDAHEKLVGYFTVASIQHYLIVDPDKRYVVHHKRGPGELIETRIVHVGALALEPPGLSVPVEEMFAEADADDSVDGAG
jgi:Uma2 family endonuclease